MAQKQKTPSITFDDILKDFKVYLRLKWKWLGLPAPTRLQYEIADYYQERKHPRKIIQGFRGVAKTWIVGAYCEWRWLGDPDYRIMIVSGNQGKADEISNFIKRCIEEFPLLKKLKHPSHERFTATWGVKQFNVSGAPPDVAPSCKSASISGMITGSRAHEVIGDDVEIPGNSATVMAREKLVKQVEEFESILLPGGAVTLLGTPQTEETVYRIFESRGYKVRRWVAEVPTPETYPQYHGTLSPIIQRMFDEGLFGQATEPTRFPVDVLLQKKSGMALSTYKLQFMLDTSLSDAERYPLKLKDLVVTPLDTNQVPVTLAWASGRTAVIPELPQIGFSGDYFVKPMFVGDDWRPLDAKVMFIDPSGRGDNETSYVIGGHLLGRVYLQSAGGFLDGYSDETLDALLKLAREASVTKIYYEDNFGDGMFGKVLLARSRTQYPVAIEPFKAKGNKEARMIDTLEPLMRQHKLVVNLELVSEDIRETSDTQAYSLFYQMSRVTRDRGCLKYDDRLDTVAALVAHFTRSMAIDTEVAINTRKAEEKQQMFNEWLEGSIVFRDNKEALGYRKQTTKFNKVDPRSGQRRDRR